jgi:hypothetical protein
MAKKKLFWLLTYRTEKLAILYFELTHRVMAEYGVSRKKKKNKKKKKKDDLFRFYLLFSTFFRFSSKYRQYEDGDKFETLTISFLCRKKNYFNRM